MGNNTLIDRKGKIHVIPQGESHYNFGRRVLKRDFIRLLHRGWIRTAFFESLTQRVFCIESGKNLTVKQKNAIIEVYPGKCTKLIWKIGDKNGGYFHDTGIKLIELLGV